MNEFLFPLSLVSSTSLFKGTFGLGMNCVKSLAWQTRWLVQATVAMLLPFTRAFVVVPDRRGLVDSSAESWGQGARR